jgi:alpha-amylase
MVADMKHRQARKVAPLVAAAALSLLATPACMQFDAGSTGPLELSTHVADWRQEIIYQVLVDRFADGDYSNDYNVDLTSPGHWHGGDWLGIENHLDYVAALGVTTIWISPVVKNVDSDSGFDGYHGYWSQDLTQVNPHFGDLPALRHLVAAAHERDMKVILDLVTNHVGQLFYYDIEENGQPDVQVCGSGATAGDPAVALNEYDPPFDPDGVQAVSSLGPSGPAPIVFLYDPATNHMPPEPAVPFQNPDAYNRKGGIYDFNDPDQLVHGDFPGGLKDLNTTRCDVKQAYVDVYASWVEQTDLDGFRIDTVKHVEREFWRYFAQKIRQRLAPEGKRNFYMFGEAFDGRDELVGAFTMNDLPEAVDLARENLCVINGIPITGDQLDGVFYFPQYYTAIQNVFTNSQATQQIQDLWTARLTDFGTVPMVGGIGIPPTRAQVNFLDNHDVPRFLYSGRGTDALHNALLFIFGENGVPCVYYGTEQEFSGGNDPANREDLWSSNYDTTGPTFQWIQRLTSIRKNYKALQDGNTNVVWASTRFNDEPDAGIFAYERTGAEAGDDYALLVLNTSPTHPSSPEYDGTPMTVTQPPGTVLVDILSPTQATYTVNASSQLSIQLPADHGALLIPQSQVIPGI